MALPSLTPEQRAAALEKAAVARKQRAEVKERLKHSGASLESVLADADNDEVIGKMKVSAVLEALPGVGKVRAQPAARGGPQTFPARPRAHLGPVRLRFQRRRDPAPPRRPALAGPGAHPGAAWAHARQATV